MPASLQTNFVDLEYPLNNPDEYKGRIIFNVMKEPETDLGNVLGAVTSATSKLGSAAAEKLGITSPEDKAKAVETAEGQTNSFQASTKPRPLIDLNRQVSMYLPVGLQFRDNVAYENMDIGMGAAAEAGVKRGVSAIGSLIEGGLKTLGAGLTGNASTEVAKLATVKLASRLPDELSGALKSAAGVTTNPNTRVLFKSVALREFSFAFKFLATSAKEAEEVKEIIKLFRTELYPENINLEVGGSEISIGYKFPNKFQISVEYDGDEIATRIKPCFLRDVSVTYNNTSMSMHEDGNFTEIEMTLSFQETRTLNRKDVEEDGF